METGIKLQEWLSKDNNGMIRASISRRWEELIHAYPKLTVSQLTAFLYRGKGEVQGSPWNWSDKTYLKKLEKLQSELAETYNSDTGEFEDFDYIKLSPNQ